MIRGDAGRRLGALLLALGLLIQIASRVYQVWVPVAHRAAPIEADDAYTYIDKAVQLQTCFRQDCAALNDLRRQLQSESTDPRIAWVRYREYGRAFLVYHPLHSVWVCAAHLLGLSWEAAYEMIEVCGGAFIGAALGVWLWALWGPGAAGIGLMLSAFVLFPNQGLNHIVPGNLALGIAALTWAAMTLRPRHASWLVPAGVLGMVTMHPTGRLYAFVTVAAFVLLQDRRLERRALFIGALGLSILVAAFAVPHLVSRPEMNVKPDPSPEFWIDWWGYVANVLRAWGIIKNWVSQYGGFIIVMALVTAGLIAGAPDRRRRILVFAALIASLTAASMFVVLPRYPANLFSRLWVSLAILLTAAMGQAIWSWLLSLLSVHEALRPEARGPRAYRTWAFLIALLVIGGVLARCVAGAVATGTRALREKTSHRTDRESIELDPNQALTLLASSTPADAVVYTAELPMHFLLAHGALSRGAVFAPAVLGTPEQARWLDDNKAIRFVAGWSPIQRLAIAREGALLLEPGDRLGIDADPPRSLPSLSFLVDNPGPAARLLLRIMRTGDAESDRTVGIEVPARTTGWRGSGQNGDLGVSRLTLETPGPGPALRIRGMRADQGSGSPLSWPWGAGIRLTYLPRRDGSPAATVSFDPAELCPVLKRSLWILSDTGSTVLAQVGD